MANKGVSCDMKTEASQRAKRVRTKILTQKAYPRLSVFRSNRHLYGQIIDDQKRETQVAVSTLVLRKTPKRKSPKEIAWELGKELAQKALKKGIKKVVFDRGSYRFWGQVKSLAEGAREGGLKF